MEREAAVLRADRVPPRARLPPRDAGRDHNVAQMTGRSGRKRQDVGGAVDVAKLPIERAHLRVAHQRDGDIALRRAGGDAGEPAAKTVGALHATEAVGDGDLQTA